MMLRCGIEIILRDLTPEDQALYPEFHTHVSGSDRRLRFFSAAPVSERQMYRLTHFDPHDAVVLAAVGANDGLLYGVGRIHSIGGGVGEFAVMVRSDLKGQGLGRRLLEEVIARASTIGVTEVMGLILRENICMLSLAEELGFTIRPDPGEVGVMRASLSLSGTAPRLAA